MFFFIFLAPPLAKTGFAGLKNYIQYFRGG